LREWKSRYKRVLTLETEKTDRGWKTKVGVRGSDIRGGITRVRYREITPRNAIKHNKTWKHRDSFSETKEER